MADKSVDVLVWIVFENPQVESPELVVRQAHHPELCRRIEGRPPETKEILQESRVVKQGGGKGIRRGDAETRRRGVGAWKSPTSNVKAGRRARCLSS